MQTTAVECECLPTSQELLNLMTSDSDADQFRFCYLTLARGVVTGASEASNRALIQDYIAVGFKFFEAYYGDGRTQPAMKAIKTLAPHIGKVIPPKVYSPRYLIGEQLGHVTKSCLPLAVIEALKIFNATNTAHPDTLIGVLYGGLEFSLIAKNILHPAQTQFAIGIPRHLTALDDDFVNFVRDKSVLVVDDCTCTYRTLKTARDILVPMQPSSLFAIAYSGKKYLNNYDASSTMVALSRRLTADVALFDLLSKNQNN